MKRVTSKFKQIMKDSISVLFYVFRIFRIRNNRVIFLNYYGRGYGDSCKYIAEELLKNENLDIVWSVSKKNNDIPKRIRQVKYFSFRWIYEMVTSKCWINNSRFPSYVRKRKKQCYIQVWHGGLALKKIEFDAVNLPKKYVKNMLNDNKMIDYLISNSTFCTNMYRKSFKYNGVILEYGTPRNDCLINNKDILKKRALENLNLSSQHKVLLYVPTFRSEYKQNPYDINFEKVMELLKKKYSCDWNILIKLHPNIKDSKKYISSNNLLDVSNYSDLQELICLADLVITDYSSTMFESVIADKPVILYANDIEEYKRDRGLYFEFSDLPFPLVENNEELYDFLKNENIENIKNKYDRFINKVGLKEEGKASKMVSSLILNELLVKKEDD